MMRYGNNLGMMGGWKGEAAGWATTGNNPVLLSLHWALGLITWILIIAVLFALLRWLWKKGNGK